MLITSAAGHSLVAHAATRVVVVTTEAPRTGRTLYMSYRGGGKKALAIMFPRPPRPRSVAASRLIFALPCSIETGSRLGEKISPDQPPAKFVS
jgi:hypothetical protein